MGVLSGGGHYSSNFCDVISIENLLSAWKEFRKGKWSKKDVVLFELNLENNLFDLHKILASNSWISDSYIAFSVHDPKPRRIHKASVRDRVLYQAVYRSLYPVFDSTFIHTSYSSRNYKGTHAGVRALEKATRSITRNYTSPGYAVKCDIRKFFDSIDHKILYALITEKVFDNNLLSLIKKIIFSFEFSLGKGLPLGNVTSQLFANIYLNKLDQYIKRQLKVENYIRYCDDFVLLSNSKKDLEKWVGMICQFCQEKLSLVVHPKKIIFRKIIQGVDFLGYVSLPYRRVLRTSTKRRILQKVANLRKNLENGLITQEFFNNSIQSYLGVLSHVKGEKISLQIERLFWD